jgi:hypothetical protein
MHKCKKTPLPASRTHARKPTKQEIPRQARTILQIYLLVYHENNDLAYGAAEMVLSSGFSRSVHEWGIYTRETSTHVCSEAHGQGVPRTHMFACMLALPISFIELRTITDNLGITFPAICVVHQMLQHVSNFTHRERINYTHKSCGPCLPNPEGTKGTLHNKQTNSIDRMKRTHLVPWLVPTQPAGPSVA